MGACDYFFTKNGKLTVNQCNNALKEQQRKDKEENGHQHGYSGDSQTVSEVKLYEMNFTDVNEAQEFCLDKAKKWDYFVAVYVDNKKTLIGGWAAC